MKLVSKSFKFCGFVLSLAILSLAMSSCKDDGIGGPYRMKWKVENPNKKAVKVNTKGYNKITVEVGNEACSVDLICVNDHIFFHSDKSWDPDGDNYEFYNFSNEWVTLKIGPVARIHCEFKSLEEAENSNSFSIGAYDGSRGTSIFFKRKGYVDVETNGESEPFEMKVRVNGEPHSGLVRLDSEENYVYLDSDFKRLMEDVSADANMEVLILDDEFVDYIDRSSSDADELVKRLISESRPSTRAATTGFELKTEGPGYFGAFEHENFGGININGTLERFGYSQTRQNLKTWGINDKISSIAVAYDGNDPEVCTVVTVWDDAYFNYGDHDHSKHRMTIIASYNNRRVVRTNLKNVKCLNSSKSWNDRISAVAFHFGYVDSILKDY